MVSEGQNKISQMLLQIMEVYTTIPDRERALMSNVEYNQ